MAIKNEKLGGTDYSSGPAISLDLNDTFDKVVNVASLGLSTTIGFALDSETTTNQTDLHLDLFATDTSEYLEYVVYDSGSYLCVDTSSDYFVIIQATSLTPASFEINGCKCVPFSANKWMLYHISDSYEVNRSQVFRTLFENGSSAIIMTAASGVGSIQSPDSNDVGKEAGWAYTYAKYYNQSFSATTNLTGVFENTSTNTNCSSWSNCYAKSNGGFGIGSGIWEIPNGTKRNQAYASNTTTTSNEIGTDTSGDELNNPASCDLYAYGKGSDPSTYGEGKIWSLILSAGSIEWSENKNSPDGGGEGGGWTQNFTEYHFTGSGNIPLITSTNNGELSCVLTTGSHNLDGDETNVIVKADTTLDSGVSISAEITFNNGSNWKVVTLEELDYISDLGSKLKVRFTITRLSGSDSGEIDGYGCIVK